MAKDSQILYCNCTYAKVVPPQTKQEVLRALTASGQSFEAVADLCEMSARHDPELQRLSECDNLKIVACFPRAVKWLFHAAGAPLSENKYEIHNMREQQADEMIPILLEGKSFPQEKST